MAYNGINFDRARMPARQGIIDPSRMGPPQVGVPGGSMRQAIVQQANAQQPGLQSVAEILSQSPGDLGGATNAADRQRQIADMLMQGANSRQATDLVTGFSKLGEAFIARGAGKRADTAEAKRDEIVSMLTQKAMQGDEASIAALLGPEAAIGRRDTQARQGVEDEFTRTQLGQGQQGLDQNADQFGQTMGLQQDQFGEVVKQNQFGNELALDQFGLQAELGRGGLAAQRASAATSGRFGVTPVFGRDENGNRIMLQASNAGGVTQVALPEGVTLEDDYSRTFDRETAKEDAKKAAYESTAGQALTAFENKTDELLLQIDDAVEKTTKGNTGFIGQFIAAGDLDGVLSSIGAKAMLSELVAIKAQGGTLGALSDSEGKALRDAAVNVARSQSEKQLDRNLKAYRLQVEKSRMVLKQAFEDQYVNAPQAVGGAADTPTQTATNPQTGEKIGLVNGQWVPIQ